MRWTRRGRGRRRGTRTGRKENESETTLASGFSNVTKGVICNAFIISYLVHFSLSELTSQELFFTSNINTLQITVDWRVDYCLGGAGGVRRKKGRRRELEKEMEMEMDKERETERETETERERKKERDKNREEGKWE